MTVVTLPASPEATARGCTCPTSTNDNGRGVVNPETGHRYWLVKADCPLHGYASDAPHEMEDGR